MIVVIVPLSFSCYWRLVDGGEEGEAFAALGHGSEKSYLEQKEGGCEALDLPCTCPWLFCFCAHLCWVRSGFLRCRYTESATEEWITYK